MISYNQTYDVTDVEPSAGFTEPVDLQEVKDFIKVSVDDDNTLITMLITACRIECEQLTNIGFIRRDIIADINNANGSAYLPFGPHGEVTSVKDVDETELDFTVTNSSFKQLLSPCYSRLTVECEAGYETLPEHLKLALLECIFYRYDERKMRENAYPPVYLDTLKQYSRVW